MAGFATDPRIHFSKVTGKWEFEDDDGNEMEWDMAKQAWVPVVCLRSIILPSSLLIGCAAGGRRTCETTTSRLFGRWC